MLVHNTSLTFPLGNSTDAAAMGFTCPGGGGLSFQIILCRGWTKRSQITPCWRWMGRSQILPSRGWTERSQVIPWRRWTEGFQITPCRRWMERSLNHPMQEVDGESLNHPMQEVDGEIPNHPMQDLLIFQGILEGDDPPAPAICPEPHYGVEIKQNPLCRCQCCTNKSEPW